MMNGYSSIDLLGRTGKNLSVTVDGQRMLFRGEPAVPCVLKLNGNEAALRNSLAGLPLSIIR